MMKIQWLKLHLITKLAPIRRQRRVRTGGVELEFHEADHALQVRAPEQFIVLGFGL